MTNTSRSRESQPAMITRSFGRVIAAWHSPDVPSDAEWEEMLRALRVADLTATRGLILTAGGAPTAGQRRAMVELVGVRPIPVAIVSDQIAVRFVASLFAMMTKRIRTFPSSDLRAAYRHLELTLEEARGAEAFVADVGFMR